jgi:two-component system chemotaxis response regulator CheY
VKCLVVSASATLRRILAIQLRGLGCDEVLEATDGQQAVDRCDGTFALVLTDWSVPLVGGLELVKRLRATAATAAVPILMVSSRSARNDVTAAVEAGVDDYVLRPFNPETLRAKLETLLHPPSSEDSPAQAA